MAHCLTLKALAERSLLLFLDLLDLLLTIAAHLVQICIARAAGISFNTNQHAFPQPQPHGTDAV